MSHFDEFIHFVSLQADEDAYQLLDSFPALASARSPLGVSIIAQTVYLGRLDVAREIARRRQDLDLFEASCIGDRVHVESLLSRSPDAVDRHSPDGYTPLMLAAHLGHLELVELLIARGAELDANSANAMQVAPLHSAAAHPDPAQAALVSRTLLDAGADPNSQQRGGYTALHEAVLQQNYALAETLLEFGASPHVSNDEGDSPLQIAVAARAHLFVRLLERDLLKAVANAPPGTERG